MSRNKRGFKPKREGYARLSSALWVEFAASIGSFHALRAVDLELHVIAALFVFGSIRLLINLATERDTLWRALRNKGRKLAQIAPWQESPVLFYLYLILSTGAAYVAFCVMLWWCDMVTQCPQPTFSVLIHGSLAWWVSLWVGLEVPARFFSRQSISEIVRRSPYVFLYLLIFRVDIREQGMSRVRGKSFFRWLRDVVIVTTIAILLLSFWQRCTIYLVVFALATIAGLACFRALAGQPQEES